jgi:integral membrane protein (TIGR01906 family)
MFKLPQWALSAASACLVLAIPIILIATPLYVYVRPGFVEGQYARPGFPPSFRFDAAERLRLSEPILLYLRGRVSVEELAATRTDAGEIALLPDEVQHLVDVRRVMDGFFVAHGVACVLGVAAGISLWRSARRAEVPRLLRLGVWIAFGLMGLVLLSSFVDFDAFFTRFHQLFFREGSWLFYEEDTLIQLYPLPLWVDVVQRFALTILAEAIGVVALAWGLDRHLRRETQQ